MSTWKAVLTFILPALAAGGLTALWVYGARRELVAVAGVALAAGVPGDDQLAFGARDAHVEQAQAFAHVVQPRAGGRGAFFVILILTGRFEGR